ncbi:MAG TPA: HAD-IC family P-type ATPase, partial [Allocoleopsis sp.]
MNPSSHNNSMPDVTTQWHTLNVEKTITVLGTDPDNGLSTEQIQQRSQYYGLNELEEGAKRSNLQIFIDQFTNIMLVMLIVVAFISGIIDIVEWEKVRQSGGLPFKDTIAILTIVILNGILGYLQEAKAEEALAALKKLSSPKVRVIRDSKQQEIDGKNLVPGDIMLLEAGVQVPADGRLIEESSLQVRESALTGEAHSVTKQVELELQEDTSLGDRINLVFQGTEVGQGRAKVVVTRTGMKTELGKIASMLQSVESEPTPLQQRMTQLGNTLVSGSLTLVGIVIVVGLIYALAKKGFDLPVLGNVFKELVEISLSMAVAVVPEGLPAVITVTLALGTQRMVQRKALIRKLPAVETLGSVTNICSDKTGTLTQNKMVVQRVETPSNTVKITGEGYEPNGEFYLASSNRKISPETEQELQQLMLGCVLCNDSVLQYDNNQWIILGDPTEGALIVLAGKGGVDKEPLQKQMPRVGEIPFTSERKRMSVICDGSTTLTNH